MRVFIFVPIASHHMFNAYFAPTESRSKKRLFSALIIIIIQAFIEERNKKQYKS